MAISIRPSRFATVLASFIIGGTGVAALADSLPVVRLNKNASQSSDAIAFYTASYWGDGTQAPYSGADYIVANGYSIRVPDGSAATFEGHTLQIGEVGGASGTLIVWGNSTKQTYASDGGLILAKGSCVDYRSGNKANTICGRVVVTAPNDNPFSWQGSASLNETYSGVYFEAPIVSDVGSALTFSDNGQKDWHVDIKGSLAGCQGRINLQTSFGSWLDLAYAGARLVIYPNAGTAMPGEIVLGEGTALYPSDKSVDFTIGKLTMKEGSLLRVVGDSAGAHSIFRVSDDFVFPDKDGAVLLDVSGLYKNTEVLRTAIFSAPTSSGFTEKTFRTAADDGAAMFPHYSLEYEDANGVRTLYLVTKIVDACTKQGNCLNSPSIWSSGVLPGDSTAANHDFYNSYFWLSTSNVTGDKNFYSSATLTLGGSSASFELYNPKFTVSELRLANGSKVYGSQKYATSDSAITALAPTGLKTLKATIRAPWLKRETVNLVGVAGAYWLYDGMVTGNGTVYLHNAAGTNNAYYELKGDNSGFGGAIKLGTDSVGTGGAVLVVKDAKNLGGVCRSYRADGLTLSTGAVLWPRTTMTLEEPTRGITVQADSEVKIEDGTVVTVKENIEWKAKLAKTGAGVLAIGGTAGVAAADAANAKLAVRDGELKVVSSSALSGVAVELSEGTGLRLNVPAPDASLQASGLAPASLSIPASGVVCSFDVDQAALSGLGSYRMAVCTVSSDEADSVRARLRLQEQIPGFNVRMKETTDEQAGTVTFSAHFSKGLILLIK